MDFNELDKAMKKSQPKGNQRHNHSSNNGYSHKATVSDNPSSEQPVTINIKRLLFVCWGALVAFIVILVACIAGTPAAPTGLGEMTTAAACLAVWMIYTISSLTAYETKGQ